MLMLSGSRYFDSEGNDITPMCVEADGLIMTKEDCFGCCFNGENCLCPLKMAEECIEAIKPPPPEYIVLI